MAAADTPQDDDALFVLTAALLTPGQYPGVLGDDYPSACAELGLAPAEAGYGLVFGQDGTGARWTVATTDTWMVACALAAWDCGLEYELSPDDNSIAASLPGWPLPVAVAAPGVPAPFDPDEETGGGPALAPPDPTQWGPAQRRLGADEIAIHWREWRDEFDAPAEAEEPSSADPGEHGEQAGSGAPAVSSTPAESGAAAEPPADEATSGAPTGPAGTNPDGTSPDGSTSDADAPDASAEPGTPAGPAADAGPVPISHSGVRGVLAAAEAYVRTPPPPGRVRLAYGSLRADGPGWSLVGRADDMAFVLLDDAPGEILPVGRGPSLPILMEALGKLASAPNATAAASS